MLPFQGAVVPISYLSPLGIQPFQACTLGNFPLTLNQPYASSLDITTIYMRPLQDELCSCLALACWAGLYTTLQACTLDNYPLKAENFMISTGGYAAGLTAKTCARKGQHRSSIKNGYPYLSKDLSRFDDLIQADNLSGDSIRHNEDRNNHHPPSIDLLYAS